jgi:hypothetical protein
MRVFTILTLLLVAIAFGLSLAHALELPGKLRLDEAAYRTVQQIYYPGFTVGGAAEPLSILALAALLYLTPFGTTRFWWITAALLLMLAAHATYWLITHPVNQFWVEGIDMSGAGSSFFSAFTGYGEARHWTELRNIWEASHVIRAGFAALGLIAIAMATSFYEHRVDLDQPDRNAATTARSR